ncbi:MAG: peptidoglycan DD-metalloendopeptidase family protein [Oscillospiraceae bacterium]|nr:peptidoglycan DD-metalloendopeptidase family protein [Oscillospiraceae bacterium]
MENRGKRQASSIFGGMGFYIALLVCVVAAGVVGYFALLRNNDPSPDPLPVSEADPGPTQSVSTPDPEPAEPVTGDAPITVERPIVIPIIEPEDTVPAPQEPVMVIEDDGLDYNEDDAPVMDPAPIEAVEPMVVVAPLVGETVATFSVDQLVYDATLGDWRTHDGVDIRAAGGTEVVAASAGIVLSVEDDGRMGTTVVLDHRNGYVTTYASLQGAAVLVGDEVPAGASIGSVGNTSLTEAGLGAHLHFSVSKDGAAMDPMEFLAE